MVDCTTYEDNFVIFKGTGLNIDDKLSEGFREKHD